MALVTTGNAADGYISVAYADTYHSERGNDDWEAATTAAKEAAIREATLYADVTYRDRFKGQIQSSSQSLEWPRTAVTDRSGRNITGIPDAVKWATAELALAALTARLDPVEERGGRIKSLTKKTGPLTTSTEYADGAPSGRAYDFADKILSSVLVSGGSVLRRA